MKKLFLLLVLGLTVSCQKTIKAPHPGALDAFDSQTYDALTVAQGVLDQAKIEFNQGKLPPNSKNLINRSGQAYNVTRDAWLQYRAVKQVGGTDTNAVAMKVTAAVNNLNQLITDLRILIGGAK